jgi:hypothetical protein
MDKDVERERRNALVADLQRLAGGWRPTLADLSGALFLDRWYFALYPGGGEIAMCGVVSDHPRLGSGQITTSPLVAIDLRAGWIRTCSRFYRLGDPEHAEPAPDEEGWP